MASEKRLIEELREMADRTPPICQYDKPINTEIFGKQITVYCKPFEQFQELLRRAADALSVAAVEVVRCKDCKHGIWDEEEQMWECVLPVDLTGDLDTYRMFHEYNDGEHFCSYGERKDNE